MPIDMNLITKVLTSLVAALVMSFAATPVVRASLRRWAPLTTLEKKGECTVSPSHGWADWPCFSAFYLAL